MSKTVHAVFEFKVGAVPFVTTRAQAAGYTFWWRPRPASDPTREVVVVGVNAGIERVEEVLAGWSPAIPVPKDIIELLSQLSTDQVDPKLADARPGTGARRLDLALLGHFNFAQSTIRLIHQYLYQLSVVQERVAGLIDVAGSVQALLEHWDLGDAQLGLGEWSRSSPSRRHRVANADARNRRSAPKRTTGWHFGAQ